MTRLLLLVLLAGCLRDVLPREQLEDPSAQDLPRLGVLVLDADGAGLDGAWVALSPGGRDAQTDGAGQAWFEGIAPGTYTLQAGAYGYDSSQASAEVTDDGGEASVTLLPRDPGATLLGSVLGPADEAVQGVSVQVGGVEVGVTAADGSYTIEGLPAGGHPIAFVPPAPYGEWAIPSVELVAGGVLDLDVALPGQPPANARYVGSQTCVLCHSGLSALDTPHAQAGRPPAALLGDASGIDLDFQSGRVVPLDPLIPGATVTLSEADPGVWFATVTDRNLASTGPLPVHSVYGAHRSGAALVVQESGTNVLIPAAWAAPGQGLSSRQAPAGWVPAWAEGWFDGDGLLALDTTAASFDLRCGGCHATGVRLEESSTFDLVPLGSTEITEQAVGCEACHGPGSEHLLAGGDPTRITNPRRLPPWQRVDVCARCHEQVTPTAHAFSTSPGYATLADGSLVQPHMALDDYAQPNPTWWLQVDASRTLADQAGELRSSPHGSGPKGYLGACEDCHSPHGSAHPASLREDPWDNALCVTCHSSRFPDVAAQADHAAHSTFAPGPWGPGSCTGCHTQRSGVDVRPDTLSGVGELHAHGLLPFLPDAILAEFDAAGVDQLSPGQVAVPGCLDCHLQVDAEKRENGSLCQCFLGDPYRRITYDNLRKVMGLMWGDL